MKHLLQYIQSRAEKKPNAQPSTAGKSVNIRVDSFGTVDNKTEPSGIWCHVTDTTQPTIQCSACSVKYCRGCAGALGSDSQTFVCPSCQVKSLLASSTQYVPPKNRLFALIIAISKYEPPFKDLGGTEADALAFKEYFENHLKVPTSQIMLLLKEDATRANIIQAFKNLANDPRIEKGDAIVIFFAGHGTEKSLADYGWEASQRGNMIIPYSNKRGEEVEGLPDFVIGRLISRIAERKGNNITAIFDCCHPPTGAICRKNQFRYAGLESPIVITACGASERTKESLGHGSFTVAFLKLLCTRPLDRLRYCDILTHIEDLPNQNPQCIGINQNRILFSDAVAPPSRVVFPIEFMDSDSCCLLKTGSAQGITPGAEFAVYQTDDTELKNTLGYANVHSVTAFTSTLSPRDFTTNQTCVAVQITVGEKECFRLFIPSADNFNVAYKSIQGNKANEKYDLDNITIVSTPDNAHLRASIENDQVVLEMMDERVTRHGFSRCFPPVDLTDLDRVARVLSRAAHFYWELNRANGNTTVASQIQVEFYKLKESFAEVDELGDGEFVPVQPDLCRNRIIDFVIEEDAPYGLKLTNMTKHDFYPYVFYFDNTDLSIAPHYLTEGTWNTPYEIDIPLKKAGGTLTLGYGSGVVDPFSYGLPEGQDVNVGFLKLFVSTKPINLSHIEQPSPFELTRVTNKFVPRSKGTWDTVIIPIIQRRHHSNYA